MVAGMFITSGLKYGLGHVVKEGYEKADKRTQNTEVSTAERVRYTVAPGGQAVEDLIKGDSPKEVCDKFLKTHVENVKSIARVAEEAGKDVLEGPVPKWALPFTGAIAFAINALAD